MFFDSTPPVVFLCLDDGFAGFGLDLAGGQVRMHMSRALNHRQRRNGREGSAAFCLLLCRPAFSDSLDALQVVLHPVSDFAGQINGLTRLVQIRLRLIAGIADVHPIGGEIAGILKLGSRLAVHGL